MPAAAQNNSDQAHINSSTPLKNGHLVSPPYYQIRSPFVLDQNPVEFATVDGAANEDRPSNPKHGSRSFGFLAAAQHFTVKEDGVVHIESHPLTSKRRRTATLKKLSAAAGDGTGRTSLPTKKPPRPPPTFQPLASPFSQLGFAIFLHVQQFLLRFGDALNLQAHVFEALSNTQHWSAPAVTDAAYGLLEVILPRAPHLAAELASSRRTARWEVIASVIDPALYKEADLDIDWADALAELRTLRTVNSLERVPFWCQLCCLHTLIEMLHELAPDFIRDAIEDSLHEYNVQKRQLRYYDEIAQKARTEYLDAVAADEAAAAKKSKTKSKKAATSAQLRDKKRAAEIEKQQQRARPIADTIHRLRPQISALGVDAAGNEYWSFPLHEATIYKFVSQWPLTVDSPPAVDVPNEWMILDIAEAGNLAQYLSQVDPDNPVVESLLDIEKTSYRLVEPSSD
ncbi:hypothetical protein HDU87_000492 [Geranomyces variabilis]|uniref:Uncharacterized protein n=1 Tax=Geranomyces variabilis TaxID=109894 RepID=A0AAD5TC42_9FUNG|nr:hypothetical protein HDU87_000492 [Geranomyces variabilis]